MSLELREKFKIEHSAVTLYAEVAGDPNPIHQNNKVAQEMGLRGAIAHGMFVYSYLLQRLDAWMLQALKENNILWKLSTTKCRFHEPAYIGETFESMVEVSEETETSAKLNLLLLSDKGEKLTQVVVHLTR